MKIGQAIEAFRKYPDAPVIIRTNLDSPHDGCTLARSSIHSYRGYYEDLAIEAVAPNLGLTRGGDIADDLENAIGATFHGYKGGDFIMSYDTTLWVAPYGSTGYILADVLTSAESNIVLLAEDRY